MTPSKKKLLKPKEVSLDPSLKMETPIDELPNDQNKLFDEKMMLGHLPFLTFHYPVKMRKKKPNPMMFRNMLLIPYFKLSPLHPEGKGLRKWVQYQDIETMEKIFQWNENEITLGEPHASCQENSRDKSNLEFLKTNSIQYVHI